MGLETAAIIGIAVAAGKAGADVIAANETAGGARDAAGLQTTAANHAADVQAQANRDTLAFNKSAAENQFQNTEAARKGNYDLAAGRSQYLGSIGELVGMPPHPMPAYVPGVDPQFNGPSGNASAPAGQAPAGPAPGVSAANGDIASQVAAYYKARGVAPNPTSVQYWADKWNEFGAKDPAYFNTRLSQADEFGGAAPKGSVGSYLTPPAAYAPPPLTPALQMPRPYSVGSYL